MIQPREDEKSIFGKLYDFTGEGNFIDFLSCFIAIKELFRGKSPSPD